MKVSFFHEYDFGGPMNSPSDPAMPKRPPFFTWTSPNDWKHPADVPMAIRRHARLLWLNGAKVEAIAECFEIPVEWADIFARSTEGETKH